MVSSLAHRARIFHLAQINIGRMRGPLGDPIMEGFASQLDAINAKAEKSPGFVWRFIDGARPSREALFLDPLILVNMSVWESFEDLKAYTYRSEHAGLFKERRLWFEPLGRPHLALWWTPAGHVPDLEEGSERLAHLARHGATEAAFTFKESFPSPEVEEEPSGEPPLLYDGRVFETKAKTENGEAGPGTVFLYRQAGRHVWATYDGGGIRVGRLVAQCDSAGALNGRYQHLSPTGVFRGGRCRMIPEHLQSGRLRLHEDFQWDGGGVGRAVIEERAEFSK